MIGFVEDVNIISSFCGEAKGYGKVESRKSHAFIFRRTGSVEYDFGDKKITLTEGNAIFLPQGRSYEYTAPPGAFYTSVNFYANVENPTPCIYSLDGFYDTDYIFESFSQLWRFGSRTDRYKCISVFYDFLSYIARIEHLSELDKNKYDIIEPAMEYLKTHLFDCRLKVDSLHRLCCVSDTYFRKIFVSRFNITPQEYVINRRISHAKAIIESGDYESVGEVAALVGYNDPLYFSKAFKKIYGFSPSSINR